MTEIQSVILGLVQGLTEFLPISSSGHLVIFQHFFGLKEPMLFFNVSLHFGTVCSVIYIFKKDVIALIKSPIALKSGFPKAMENKSFKLLLLIFIASIPTAIIGLGLKKIAETSLSSINIAIPMLFVTAIFLWISKLNKKDGFEIEKFTIKIAIIIGIVQGLAVLPGISRSGATIVCAIFLGVDRKLSAKYSFLLSLPAILGAEVLSLKDLAGQDIVNLTTVILGTAVAFIIGCLALKFVIKIVQKGKLYYFAPYCFIFAIIALIFK